MYITESSSDKKYQIELTLLDEVDFKYLKKDRYFFDWSKEKDFEIYKLRIVDTFDILGLISLEQIHSEWRIHIRLLTVSIENQGKEKKYDRIAGNLIAHAAKIAVREYAELACISLRPKSQLSEHYRKKHKMQSTGLTLSIEIPEILNLINLYDHD